MARPVLMQLMRASIRRPKNLFIGSGLVLLMLTISSLLYYPGPLDFSPPSLAPVLKAHLSQSLSNLFHDPYRPQVDHHHQLISNPQFNQILLDRFDPYFDAWLQRPVLSAQEAFKLNSINCPNLDNQTSPDQLLEFGNSWDQLSPESIIQHRSQLVSRLKRFLARSISNTTLVPTDTEDDFESIQPFADDVPLLGDRQQGIVVTGGNKDTMIRLLVMLRILRRRLHSLLPVQVFMFPDELEQLSSHLKAEFTSLGGITIKSLPYKKAPGVWKNFHIKGVSIIHSTFTQVLYLDSDNIPLVNPDFLFNSESFKRYGIVLWPDISKDGPRNPIWRITGTPCIPQDWQVESGQILLDKRAQRGLVFGSLLVAAQMQLDHKFWFTLSKGDKDTFRYALYALQLPWTRAPHWVSSGGAYDPDTRFCGHTMVQYSLSSSDWGQIYPQIPTSSLTTDQRSHAPPLFAHANLRKYDGGRFGKGKTWVSLRRVVPRDLVEIGNVNVVDRVRTSVPERVLGGMCVEYRMMDRVGLEKALVPSASLSSLTDHHQEEVEVGIVDESWLEAWGGAMKGFEKMYWDEGGL